MTPLVYMLQTLGAGTNPYPVERILVFLPSVDWWGWDAITGKPTSAVRSHCEREVDRPHGAVDEDRLRKTMLESYNAAFGEAKP